MRRTFRLITTVVVIALCAAAVAFSDNSTHTASSEEATLVANDSPGVTDEEIRVGGVASVTNPLNLLSGEAFDGVEAYFEMINAEGGVHGRELELVDEADDKLANNKPEIIRLIDSDIFAILPVASYQFQGADEAVQAKVPTFGWVIDPAWAGTQDNPKENLFGQAGSYLGIGDATLDFPFIANQIDATNIGVLAYNIAPSPACAAGIRNSFEQYGGEAEVVYVDDAVAPLPQDLSVQVNRMKDEQVDLVVACMDMNGVIQLAQDMKQHDLDAVQYLLNAYNPDLLTEHGDLFEGSYVLSFFAPFDTEDPPPGMRDYLKWMGEVGGNVNEISMSGWLNAALFVEGLERAGPNFSRQKVIDALNEINDWTADGLLYEVDWTKEHTEGGASCNAFSRVEDGEFVHQFAEPGKPFVCLEAEPGEVPEGSPSE